MITLAITWEEVYDFGLTWDDLYRMRLTWEDMHQMSSSELLHTARSRLSNFQSTPDELLIPQGAQVQIENLYVTHNISTPNIPKENRKWTKSLIFSFFSAIVALFAEHLFDQLSPSITELVQKIIQYIDALLK